MKKLSFTHVVIALGYLFVLIQSLRAMFYLLEDSSSLTSLLSRLGIAVLWSAMLMFCGLFVYQTIKHETNE